MICRSCRLPSCDNYIQHEMFCEEGMRLQDKGLEVNWKNKLEIKAAGLYNYGIFYLNEMLPYHFKDSSSEEEYKKLIEDIKRETRRSFKYQLGRFLNEIDSDTFVEVSFFGYGERESQDMFSCYTFIKRTNVNKKIKEDL